MLKGAKKELARIQNSLYDCGLRSDSADFHKVDSFVKPDFQHGIIKVDDGDVCNIPKYETNTLDAATVEKERLMYKKAMQVFCDMNAGQAFSQSYDWPVML